MKRHHLTGSKKTKSKRANLPFLCYTYKKCIPCTGGLTSIQQPLIVAVCGDSGSGKTTLTDGMVRVFGQERVTHICLDDYHILDRATRLRAGITALHPA